MQHCNALFNERNGSGDNGGIEARRHEESQSTNINGSILATRDFTVLPASKIENDPSGKSHQHYSTNQRLRTHFS